MRRIFDELLVWDRPDAENGAEQMALDEAMLRMANAPTLRVYRWRAEEITFGYPMRWSDAEAFAAGRRATRRCTGGGLVEHGSDVTIALAVPATHPFSRIAPPQAYREIHESLREAIGESHIELAPGGHPAPACFDAPSPHDLVHGSRKIAGGALRRSREGLLYQGSIQHITLDERFSDRIARAFSATFAHWNPPVGIDELCAALVRERYDSEEWSQRR